MAFGFRLLAQIKFYAHDIERSDLDEPTKRLIFADCLSIAQKISPSVDEFNQDYARETITALDALAHP
jgi:hypothetical protein